MNHGWALVTFRGTYPALSQASLLGGFAAGGVAVACTRLACTTAAATGSEAVARFFVTSTVPKRASSQSAPLAAFTRRSFRYPALYRGVREW